jgi:hypothetical protein
MKRVLLGDHSNWFASSMCLDASIEQVGHTDLASSTQESPVLKKVD